MLNTDKVIALVDPSLRYNPTVGTLHGIEALVALDIVQRQNMGIQKYGTTVSENPLELRQWLQHAYEEALDQAIYLKRAIEEIDRKASQ